MSPRFAHLVNPVAAPGESDLAVAQPITFESMRRARVAAAAAGLEVELHAAAYPEDERVIEGFSNAPVLIRSVLDYGPFREPRKLPLVGDLLARLYAASRADYFIYTNVDIALKPEFYCAAAELLDAGAGALSINRRTVHATPAEARSLDWLYAQAGEPHPGHDCFVFPRALLEGVDFGELCIGFPPVGQVMVALLSSLAPGFRLLDDRALTFHLNDDRSWQARDRFADYWAHNQRAALRILHRFDAALSPLGRALRDEIRQRKGL